MKLGANPFTHALHAGHKQFGLWISLCSNLAADVVAGSGYDWVVLDMEHTPNDIGSILGQLQVFSGSRTTALVRPEWNDPVLVKRLLDLGARGLVFPMVQSVEEAEKAVAATRYPPRGIRGVAGSTRATGFGRVTDYVERVEEETTVIVQLETVAALSRAEDIAAVDGVDAVFFGPGDIAADLGLVGKPMSDPVWDAILPVAAKLIDKGVPVGTLMLDPQMASRLFNDGFTFVACGVDTALLARAADDVLARVKDNVRPAP